MCKKVIVHSCCDFSYAFTPRVEQPIRVVSVCTSLHQSNAQYYPQYCDLNLGLPDSSVGRASLHGMQGSNLYWGQLFIHFKFSRKQTSSKSLIKIIMFLYRNGCLDTHHNVVSYGY